MEQHIEIGRKKTKGETMEKEFFDIGDLNHVAVAIELVTEALQQTRDGYYSNPQMAPSNPIKCGQVESILSNRDGIRKFVEERFDESEYGSATFDIHGIVNVGVAVSENTVMDTGFGDRYGKKTIEIILKDIKRDKGFISQEAIQSSIAERNATTPTRCGS